jgi:hypothetical protein
MIRPNRSKTRTKRGLPHGRSSEHPIAISRRLQYNGAQGLMDIFCLEIAKGKII